YLKILFDFLQPGRLILTKIFDRIQTPGDIPPGHHVGVYAVIYMIMELIGWHNVMDLVLSEFLVIGYPAGPEERGFDEELGGFFPEEFFVSGSHGIVAEPIGHIRGNMVLAFPFGTGGYAFARDPVRSEWWGHIPTFFRTLPWELRTSKPIEFCI